MCAAATEELTASVDARLDGLYRLVKQLETQNEQQNREIAVLKKENQDFKKEIEQKNRQTSSVEENKEPVILDQEKKDQEMNEWRASKGKGKGKGEEGGKGGWQPWSNKGGWSVKGKGKGKGQYSLV